MFIGYPSKKTLLVAAMAAAGIALPITAPAQTAVTSDAAGNKVNLPFSLGYRFTVTENMDLTALGQFDIEGDGFNAAAKIALFNWDTGAKLVETTLAGAVLEETGFYDTHFVSVPTLTLTTGVNYLVAVEVAASGFVYGNNIVTFDSAVDWIEGRATPVGSPAMPAAANGTTFSIARTAADDGNSTGSYFGPNMKFDAGVDEVPPTLDTLTSVVPADGATDVPFSSNLEATFSEPIALTGAGTITLKNLSGGADIPVNLPGDVSISGAVLTIDPASSLAAGDEYAVEISNDAIRDLAAPPNAYAGLLSTDTPNWSFTAAPPDTTPPTPDPMTFATAPYPDSATSITMEASVASDSAGVEYYFAETSGNPGGDDSGWQSGTTYKDTGLTTGLTYTYTVRARDLSANQNATQPSDPAAATAEAPPDPPSVITITSPTSRHIVQRSAGNTGSIAIAGTYTSTPSEIQARAVVMAGGGNSGATTAWLAIDASPDGGSFAGTLTGVPAGGWYQIEVRGVVGGVPGAAVVRTKIGVGDIYVTAGQSNSANYGSGGYTASDDRVCARTAVTGANWILAADPIPIASGGGGCVWTRLGDLLAAAEDIPVGFIALGVGSTQVSQWIPGTSNYNSLLKPAVQSFPANGFRAVLWHQGESDSIAAVSAATHANRLGSMISQSRVDAGWDVPWYLAEVSFHPSPTLSLEEPVAAGQRLAVHGDPLVFLGPTTDEFHLEDAAGGKLNDSVHFNNAGLLDHAQQWRNILRATTTVTPRNGGFEDNRTPAITNLSPLADGASHIVTTTSNSDSPSVLGWRILSASGTTAADGSNGFHNPTTGTFSGAVDTVNGGILPNMNGKHVAMLDGGTAGNFFLHSTRALAQPNRVHTLTVALGVRDDPAAFGGARVELTANGAVVASGSFDKAALDTLRGGNSAGTFTDVSVQWITGDSAAPNQPLAIRIVKEGGAGTVLDFDNVRLTSSPNDFNSWISDPLFGLDPADLDFGDDPDGDRLANGLEAWLGTHPGQFNAGLAAISSNATTTTFTHPQNVNPPSDVNGFYEWSSNLINWFESGAGPVGGPVITLVPAPAGNTTTVTATASEAMPRLFLRAGVTRN
jgi:hypothetical protein